MLSTFINWLASTSLSGAIRNYYWVVPVVQSIHILGIATIMASIVMIDLRLLGVVGRSQSVADVGHRFLPWVWGALAVLASSGSILIIGEPARELDSEVFWAKMTLLACALALTGTFQHMANTREGFWERRRVLSGVTGAVSLLLFVGIVAAGRWIAYWAYS
jgi:hypothetical protein